MPEPLKSKDKNGAPFTRPPEVEDCLGALESVNAAARLKAFAVMSRKGSGYVPSEALTYFLRRAHATGATNEFKQIFGLLMKRVGQSLSATVSDSRMAGAQGIREEIMGRFAERIAKDCTGRFAMLGEVAKQIDEKFSAKGWRELRLDLVTYGLMRTKSGALYRRLPRVVQEGYLVDNAKGSVALDVEWNAKDGNLDRDFGAYRAWHAAGALTAAVLITQDRVSLKALAEELWAQYQATLDETQRSPKLPIDVNTSTTTNFDKALLRVRRGAVGACPLLIVAACRETWNGQPYKPYTPPAAPASS